MAGDEDHPVVAGEEDEVVEEVAVLVVVVVEGTIRWLSLDRQQNDGGTTNNFIRGQDQRT